MNLGRTSIFLLFAGSLCAQPTFNKDVLPIFQQQCQICHHPSAIGPFSLMDYPSTQPCSTATVTVTRSDDGARQSVRLPIQPAHPGIYTASGDGTGAALAVHTGAGLVSAGAPASRGEWLVLYADGLGPVAPGVPSGAVPDGLSATVNPVSVTVGGVDAEVYFAGLAPGFVGLYQINFRVPPGAPAGPAVPLSLTVAGVKSNPVTLSIQ